MAYKSSRRASIYGFFALSTLLCPTAAIADDFGHYVGKVVATFDPPGRTMTLVEEFGYVDPRGKTWVAPVGSVIDGASIPKAFWSIIGGPFEGKYRDASVIHDVACDEKRAPWEAVHETFYFAMRASGVDPSLAKTMYAAVYYFGPRWERKVKATNYPTGRPEIALKSIQKLTAPGSTFKVLSANNRAQQAEPTEANPLETSDFIIAISPPTNTLDSADFAQLEKWIEDTEAAKPDSVTLQEIQSFSPK